MMYDIFAASDPALAPWIESYVQVTGDAPIPPKRVLPRSGSTLVFDLHAPYILDGARFTRSVSGIYEHAHELRSLGSRSDRLMIRFAPWGLARFTDLPADRIANRVLLPEELFGTGIIGLHERLAAEPSAPERIGMIEAFLRARLRPPDQIDARIAALAAAIRRELDGDVGALRAAIPLSDRQIERRFKATVGVSMRSFARICRFEHASAHLPVTKASLTEVGYGSGYFDQSHFIREFRRIAELSPGDFEHCVPLPPVPASELDPREHRTASVSL